MDFIFLSLFFFFVTQVMGNLRNEVLEENNKGRILFQINVLIR